MRFLCTRKYQVNKWLRTSALEPKSIPSSFTLLSYKYVACGDYSFVSGVKNKEKVMQGLRGDFCVYSFYNHRKLRPIMILLLNYAKIK